MYNKEFKNELKKLSDIIKEFDRQFTEYKITKHNLEKMGLNAEELNDYLENLGIELYKIKNKTNDFIKENI